MPNGMVISLQALSISALFLLFLLPGCVASNYLLATIPPEGIELRDVPFYPQEEYQCGPSSLAMLLGASGINVYPDSLSSQVYLPERKGCLQLELIAACRRHKRVPFIINPDISSLIAELKAGRPVLVLQNYGLESLPAYHYAVAFGIFHDGRILLHSGKKKRQEMSMMQFLMSWNRTGSWGMIALKPGELPAQGDPIDFLTAVSSFETHGYFVEAEKSYQAALKKWPDDQDFLFALGNNYLLQNKLTGAELLYKQILKENPHHLASANNLAEVFFRKECYSQALITITHALYAAKKSQSSLEGNILHTKEEIIQQINSINPDLLHISASPPQEIPDLECSQKQ